MGKLVNRARMTTATTGTGTITLGSAVSGYTDFATAGVANADVVSYCIEDGTSWELGTGTYTSAGTTLSRTVTLSSAGGTTALTLSGSAQVFVTALAADLFPVPAPNGGTGFTSYTVGDVLYASGTSALSKLADVATGNALISGGVGVAPSWGQIGLTTHVTGTLAGTNGGTGQNTYAVGDLLQGAATNTLAKLAAVATGNALISGGVTTASSWGKIGLTTHVSGTLPSANGGVPTGAVMPFAGSSAPTGWALCDGSAISRSTFAALFTAISTTYGVGDGSTTFNLPDLRGRVVAGVDNMGGTTASRITAGGSGITGTTLGANGGAETNTLTTAQLAVHSHTYGSNTSAGTGSGNPGVGTGTNSTSSNAGSGTAHNNTQPTLILNYIIKT